ncbi:hypothetical protein MTBPR1_100188 [Candidatus Terasakiella magnetica]|uniref:Hemerythrin-like domain-containing protein n=1 Tax=Candidatus Terasakiella magnetica TaxID=1867952 RepID=A0A1C3RE27_9PROT|nr:bacteriohemerythrin [Candidatus Terasakiella magnetica]SCA55547.1 hypothetical protein MTBPR1_100188 [Candidatus Terasakiella magnetica]
MADGMEQLFWNEKKYSVGCDTIDQQHKQIFGLINQLSTASSEMIDDEMIMAILEELLEYSQEHLRYEEEVMEKCNYADLENHKQQHWQYLEKVSALSVSAMGAEKEATKDIVTFLNKWWGQHILAEDMKYRPAIEKMKGKI